MADDVKSQFESVLKTLLDITQTSGNLRKDLKQDIVQSVSTLRNIIVNLKNCGEGQTIKINELAGELRKAKAEIRESRFVNLKGRELPSRGGIWQHPTISVQNELPSIGGAKKLYSEAVRSSAEKRYKLLVQSKMNLPTETIENSLKTNVNPTAMKIGVKSFKSLKDGRVHIEAGTSAEIDLLSTSIRDKCGEDLEVYVPKLRKPRMIIHNVP
jgi:hypothetical protein